MKLLLVTQTVDADDPVLGFFIGWIEEFAKHAERIEVICLKEGKHELPANVRVHSLGKEHPPRFARRLLYALRFKRLAWRLRHDYDAVFVHMNPEYIVLAGPLWRLLGKRVGLWYVHRSVNLKLRIASLFAQDIFTASPEGFGLKTSKLHVVGHGINTAAFATPVRPFHEPLRIVSVGRITPIKNLDTLIKAVALLRDKGINATVTLIGAPVYPSDTVYLESLKQLAEEQGVSGQITFTGSVPYAQMPRVYSEQDIAVNAAPTGGMDKAVLEAMACGMPTLVSNEAFAALFGPERSRLLFKQNDPQDLAAKIEALCRRDDIPALQQWARNQIVQHASLTALAARILRLLS